MCTTAKASQICSDTFLKQKEIADVSLYNFQVINLYFCIIFKSLIYISRLYAAANTIKATFIVLRNGTSYCGTTNNYCINPFEVTQTIIQLYYLVLLLSVLIC
jgi:hypothetical protein